MIRPLHQIEAEAQHILEGAIRDYGPRAIVLMLSGGNDSRSVANLCWPWLRGRWNAKGAAFIDTGISAEQDGKNLALANARSFAEERGIPFEAIRTPSDYRQIVLKHGFPGPAQHGRMYIQLKERAVRLLTRKHKALRGDRVMLVSGVRQQESVRRMPLTDPITVDGARVWVNPLFFWSTNERDAYMEAAGVERNPISAFICGSSGDCFCGAMAKPGELADIRVWFPESAARIDALAVEAAAADVPCEWGVRPAGTGRRSRACPMMLCVGCEASVP